MVLLVTALLDESFKANFLAFASMLGLQHPAQYCPQQRSTVSALIRDTLFIMIIMLISHLISFLAL